MTTTKTEIVEMVMACVARLGEEVGSDALGAPSEETPLMGDKSGVDSIALVSLIVEIETSVAEQTGMDLVLADDRAMSARRSPFRRVGSLIDFVWEKINGEA